MKKGDTVYYNNHPVTVLRAASPYVFGYLAKKSYVTVRVPLDLALKMRHYPTEKLVRTYAIPPDKLTTSPSK